MNKLWTNQKQVMIKVWTNSVLATLWATLQSILQATLQAALQATLQATMWAILSNIASNITCNIISQIANNNTSNIASKISTAIWNLKLGYTHTHAQTHVRTDKWASWAAVAAKNLNFYSAPQNKNMAISQHMGKIDKTNSISDLYHFLLLGQEMAIFWFWRENKKILILNSKFGLFWVTLWYKRLFQFLVYQFPSYFEPGNHSTY